MNPAEPRIALAGSKGLFLDCAQGAFDDGVQRRIWGTARAAAAVEGVLEVVPGMNNLLVLFDPLVVAPPELEPVLRALWRDVEGVDVAGAAHTIPVVYDGEDLAGWARRCRLSVDKAVALHAGATYSVAAIGAMPGFPYLSGLDPRLAWARRASPRMSVPEGAVIIGGAQAGLMPMTAPSGWHIVGRTATKLFDPAAATPILLQAGDTIRFAIADIRA